MFSMPEFSRTERMLGKEALQKLQSARVAVFGIGGVGGYAVEALARSGVGALDLVDSDTVSPSNLNRQIIALHSTIGRLKVDVAKERILDINPSCNVRTYPVFFLPETEAAFSFSEYDYVIDAIDTVSGKLEIIERCHKENVPLICAMGAGNKLDPTMFEVADIYKTSVCPLAKVIRTECRKRGIPHLKVVYSKELPIEPRPDAELPEGEIVSKRAVPGSIAFVPSVMGLILAGEVIKSLTGCP